MSYNARKTIIKNVGQAATALHEQNIVFGDLHRPNIIVTPKGAIHVDFEWCERHDIDRYPVTMSTEISWPQGEILVLYSCKCMMIIGFRC